ncbi:MAG: TetR/AcrR family transcriptional regulator [Erysipelotrichaceae bacterium]|nr:TetR/AcrR family transcriptional regulator [Erysipelotrichaceae bacterium]
MKQTSQDTFSQSLNQLLEITSFEDITTLQIIENTNLSRSTFYRYFDDKYDLLTYYFYHTIAPLFINENITYYESAQRFTDYCQNNRTYFMNIITDSQDTFITLLYHKYIQYMSKHMPSLTITQYKVLQIYLHGTLTYAISLFRKNEMLSAKELIYLTELSMPDILKDVFVNKKD